MLDILFTLEREDASDVFEASLLPVIDGVVGLLLRFDDFLANDKAEDEGEGETTRERGERGDPGVVDGDCDGVDFILVSSSLPFSPEVVPSRVPSSSSSKSADTFTSEGVNLESGRSSRIFPTRLLAVLVLPTLLIELALDFNPLGSVR